MLARLQQAKAQPSQKPTAKPSQLACARELRGSHWLEAAGSQGRCLRQKARSKPKSDRAIGRVFFKSTGVTPVGPECNGAGTGTCALTAKGHGHVRARGESKSMQRHQLSANEPQNDTKMPWNICMQHHERGFCHTT